MRKGLTQQQMGNIVGVSHKTISAYERGRTPVPIEILMVYKNEFDISYDSLFGREECILEKEERELIHFYRRASTVVKKIIHFLVDNDFHTL